MIFLYNNSGGRNMKELLLKKCFECGAIIRVVEDCHCDNCGIMCCGKPMKELKANSVDAAVEKHVPTYQIQGDDLVVTVHHVMEEDHYIEWIALLTDKTEEIVYLKPGCEATVTFHYQTAGNLYAYCNKHGLWKAEVK